MDHRDSTQQQCRRVPRPIVQPNNTKSSISGNGTENTVIWRCIAVCSGTLLRTCTTYVYCCSTAVQYTHGCISFFLCRLRVVIAVWNRRLGRPLIFVWTPCCARFHPGFTLLARTRTSAGGGGREACGVSSKLCARIHSQREGV